MSVLPINAAHRMKIESMALIYIEHESRYFKLERDWQQP
jgi:hypothetical protein